MSVYLIPGKRHCTHIHYYVCNHLQVLYLEYENDWAKVVRASLHCPNSSWPPHGSCNMEEHSECCSVLLKKDNPVQYQKNHQINLMRLQLSLLNEFYCTFISYLSESGVIRLKFKNDLFQSYETLLLDMFSVFSKDTFKLNVKAQICYLVN